MVFQVCVLVALGGQLCHFSLTLNFFRHRGGLSGPGKSLDVAVYCQLITVFEIKLSQNINFGCM